MIGLCRNQEAELKHNLIPTLNNVKILETKQLKVAKKLKNNYKYKY